MSDDQPQSATSEATSPREPHPTDPVPNGLSESGTLTMTVIEADGSRNQSDITKYAMLLFITGSSLSPELDPATVPFIELQLTGEWDWGAGVSDEEALRRIGNAIIDAVLEAVA
jgi:hypothetical protein